MRKWLPLMVICAGTLMLLVDVTIVNVALPDLAADLKTSFSSMQWVVDAYALTLAALVLGTGSIADQVGHRRTFVAGLTVFAVSSLTCGLAPSAGVLIAARAVQGVGGAAMFATTFPLLNSLYSGRDRGTAFGVWGAVAGASAAVGPIVGGALTEAISWRWIFFVNVPVGVGVIALSGVLGNRPTPAGARTRVDVPGIAAFTATAATATYGMIRASELGWSSAQTLGLLAAAAALLAAFCTVEMRSRAPMLDLALLRSRSFTGMLIAGFFLNFAAFAYLTYTSIWLQSVLRMSPVRAGLVGLPLSLTAFAVAALTGRLLHNARPGLVVGGGLLLIGLGGLTGVALVRGDAGWLQLVAGFAVVGLGVGLVSPMLGATTMASVPAHRGGMAGGAVNTMRQLGYAFGIALLGTVFASRAAASIADRRLPGSARLARGLAAGQARAILSTAPSGERAAVSHALHAASISGLQGILAVGGAAGLVAGLLVLALVRPARPASDAEQGPGELARHGDAQQHQPERAAAVPGPAGARR
jgi:EmrB/QacA subfamily drug resistance transporter